MTPFNFASIPGCVVWIETDPDDPENPVRNRLKERTGEAGDVFVWEDPNKPDRGFVIAYDRELDDTQRAQVEAALFALTNPGMEGLPGG